MALITVQIEEETLKSGNAELILAEINKYIPKPPLKEPLCNHKWKLNIRPGIIANKECTLCKCVELL